MRILLLVGVCCAAQAFGQGSMRYSVTDLGPDFTPYAINDLGQIAGEYHSAPAVWSNGNIVSLPVPDGLFTAGLGVAAIAINNAGQILGNGCCPYFDLLVWTNGSPSTLAKFAQGDIQDTALGINDLGQIVGLKQDSTGISPLIWQNGTPSLLPSVPNASQAERINDAGQILLRMYAGPSAGWGRFVLWQNGNVTNVTGLPGSVADSLGTLNDAGQVVGSSAIRSGSTYVSRAWLWSNGTTTDLGPPGGYNQAYALGINDAGQVVGQLIGGPNGTVAGIYDRSFGFVDLNAMVLNGSGFHLTAASAINNAGQIVGYATASDGSRHSFLLTPAPLALSTSQVTYPLTNVGSSSSANSITITNPYSSTLEIIGLSLRGPNASEFKVSSNSCWRATLAPGASCAFTVSLTPRSAGAKSAFLRILGVVGNSLPFEPYDGDANASQLLGDISLTATATGTLSIATPTYQLTDISAAVPAGAAARPADAWGLNAVGQIVGALVYPESDTCVSNGNYDSNTRAFLYDSGTVKELGMLPGARSSDPACLPQSSAAAINNSGQVLGWSNDANGNWRPVLYSVGIVRDLNELVTDGSGVKLEAGMLLNNNGVILAYGYGKFYLLNQGSATLVSDASQLQLAGFGGQSVTGIYPWRLNDLGQMLVNPDLPVLPQEALLDNGTLTALPLMSASYLGFNNNGQVVGSLFDANNDLAIWDKGVQTDLGGFPCAASNNINTLAQIVGGFGGIGGFGGSWCGVAGVGDFIWDGVNGMREIGSLTATSWLFGNASLPQINDAGQILEQAFNPADGSRHTVLLSPVVSTSPGSNVVVQTGQTMLNFSTVTTTGTTTVTPIDPSTVGTVPGGFAVSGAFAYQISTTAAFNGPVIIGFVIPPPISLDDFNALSVLHNDNGVLVDVTATTPPRDYATRTIYATTNSFSPFYLVRRAGRINILYDQTKAYKSGSTIPVKVQMLSSSGANVSSPSLPLPVRGLKLIGGGTLTAIQDSGNSNPDQAFRFDSTIGATGGYIYNLSTKGLAPGKYSLSFYAGSERGFFYTAAFDIR